MAQSHAPAAALPAWAAALASAPVEEESLSPEEARALETSRARLRAQGVKLVAQSEIERAARELAGS